MMLFRLRAGLTASALTIAAGCAVRPQPYAYYPAPAYPLPAATASGDALQARLARLDQLAGASVPPASVGVLDATPGAAPVVHLVFADPVFFDFGAADPRPEAAGVLDRIAQAIRADAPGTQITVIGHTDAVGSDAYNMDLSQQRALGVIRALVARGIDPSALSAVAVGKRQPVAPDDTEAGRAANRRVEFLISPSLEANLGVVQNRPVQTQFLSAGPPPSEAVTALRPAAVNGGVDLAAFATLDLNGPVAPAPGSPQPAQPAAAVPPLLPAAAPGAPSASPEAQPPAPAPVPAPLSAAPPAVPRTLTPDYAPRAPGAPLSY